MDSTSHFDPQRIGRTFNLAPDLVKKVAALLEEGFEPAFLARHRRAELPGVSDWQIFGVKRAIAEENALARRRIALRAHLESTGQLTPEKSDKLAAAKSTHQVDLLHAAWKRRRVHRDESGDSQALDALAIRLITGELDDASLDRELAELSGSEDVTPDPVDQPTEASRESNNDSEAAEAVADSDPTPAESTAAESTAAESTAAESTTAESPMADSVDSPSEATTGDLAQDSSTKTRLKEIIKDHLRGRIELYEGMAKFLRNRGQIVCQTVVSTETPAEEITAPEPTESQAPFAEGVAEPDVGATQTSPTEAATPAVQVVDALSADAPHVSAADIRRRRRKESRKRRRAHLESSFRDFAGAKAPVNKILPWQYLLMDHADRLRILELVVTAPVADEMKQEALQHLPSKGSACALLVESLEETVMHDILPELKRLLKKDLGVRAQSHAAKYACNRIRELLQAPAHHVRVLAIDAIAKNEAELAVLEKDGSILHTKTWKIGETGEQLAASTSELKKLVEEYSVALIALGEGNRARALELTIANIVGEIEGVGYAIITREGVEQYAASPVGSGELPQQSVKSRAAVSLGRRLQDPLLEMTKIEPRHLVSASWPLIPDENLNAKLRDAVTMSVSRLGIDANQCSQGLLAHAPGIDPELAEKIIADRKDNGPFKSKTDLQRVNAIEEASFQQASSLMTVSGENALDNSLIAPEKFDLASAVLANVDLDSASLRSNDAAPPSSQAIRALEQVNVDQVAEQQQQNVDEVKAIKLALRDSILARREANKDYAIHDKPLKFEELTVDGELMGTVSKVVSFGIFVDLGCGLTGLCHVSQMGAQIRDAREQFAVGDLKRVEIVSLDAVQRHIALRLAGVQTGGAAKREPRSQRNAARPKREKGHRKPSGPRKPAEYTTKRQRKKAPPITDEMKTGKEPMRTFGDLKQFFDIDESTDDKSTD